MLLRSSRTIEMLGDDVEAGRADLVSIGKWSLANPDFIERLKRGASLNDPNPATFYSDAVAQLADRHVDRALMVRDHHGNEIPVDIAARLDRHVVHHLGHRSVVLFQERSFIDGSYGRRLRGRVDFVRKQM